MLTKLCLGESKKMEWRGRRGSGNIEDRRSASSGAKIGGIGLVLVLIIGAVMGVDPSALLNGLNEPQSGGTTELTEADMQAGEFVSVVLADTEEIWADVFKTQLNRSYTPAVLVLYKGVTDSPCGNASGATGPFYCPVDKKVYLDTAFFTTMEQQLGASGDFAMAYVVAHEIGHHVQDELGILAQANAARAKVSQADSNAISVMIELQADCFSGIWARYVQQQFGTIDAGDFEEAVNAARQIGDDTLQRNAGRQPMPHTFTHGTSKQRSGWFIKGLNSGKLASCNTFAAKDL